MNKNHIDIIIKNKNKKQIKAIIENNYKTSEYNLTEEDLFKLLLSTNDSEYIKSIIEDENKRINIGLDINVLIYEEVDAQIIEDKLSMLIELIKATNDPEYIKSIIEDEGKQWDLGLFMCEEKKYTSNIIELIKATNDPEYIKSIIEDDDFRNYLGINNLEDITYLLIATNDYKYIKTVLKSILEQTNNEEYLNYYLKSFERNKKNIKNNSKLYLPKNMSFGIEIESEGQLSFIIQKVNNSFAPGWKCKTDKSLSEGVEIVSPKFIGSTEKNTKSIKSVCRRLERLRTNMLRTLWGTYSYWSRLSKH